MFLRCSQILLLESPLEVHTSARKTGAEKHHGNGLGDGLQRENDIIVIFIVILLAKVIIPTQDLGSCCKNRVVIQIGQQLGICCQSE